MTDTVTCPKCGVERGKDAAHVTRYMAGWGNPLIAVGMGPVDYEFVLRDLYQCPDCNKVWVE